VSHEETREERAVFAKARSKTEGREVVSKGNWVCTPGVLRRWNGTSKAASKYREDMTNSLSDRERLGSARGWWRLKSPRPGEGRRDKKKFAQAVQSSREGGLCEEGTPM